MISYNRLLDHPNSQLFVLNGINDAVVALSNAITFLAR